MLLREKACMRCLTREKERLHCTPCVVVADIASTKAIFYLRHQFLSFGFSVFRFSFLPLTEEVHPPDIKCPGLVDPTSVRPRGHRVPEEKDPSQIFLHAYAVISGSKKPDCCSTQNRCQLDDHHQFRRRVSWLLGINGNYDEARHIYIHIFSLC